MYNAEYWVFYRAYLRFRVVLHLPIVICTGFETMPLRKPCFLHTNFFFQSFPPSCDCGLAGTVYHHPSEFLNIPDRVMPPFESGMPRLVLRSSILSRGTLAWCRSLLTHPTGQHIISGSDDRTVRIWDAFTCAPIQPPSCNTIHPGLFASARHGRPG